jgi:tetratricopeptide (TPR) repeat protein
MKNYDNAIECFNKAIFCYERTVEIDPSYMTAYSKKAAALQELGKYKEALKYYDKALEIDPNDVRARDNKTDLLRKVIKTRKIIKR